MFRDFQFLARKLDFVFKVLSQILMPYNRKLCEIIRKLKEFVLHNFTVDSFDILKMFRAAFIDQF